MTDVMADVDAAFRDARHRLLVPPVLASETGCGRGRIETLLPHRGAYLLLDAVTHRDDRGNLLVATREVAAADLDDHFPGQPMWPGIQQIEAIGQTGALLTPGEARAGSRSLMLTEVLRAVFLHPVRPGAVTMAARAFDDGLFFIVVGQCVQAGRICSAAAVKGLWGEVQ